MGEGGFKVSRYRIQVTMSPAMMVALDVLAEKSGLAPATQAMVLLRSSLDRTINSEEGKRRLARYQSFATNQEWLDRRRIDKLVESAYENFTKDDSLEQAQTP